MVYPIESVLLATVGVAWLSVLTFVYGDSFMALDTVVFVSGMVLACLNLFSQMVYPTLRTDVMLVSLSLALAVLYLYGFMLSTGGLGLSFTPSCALPDVGAHYMHVFFGNALLYQAAAALSLAVLLVQVCVAVAGCSSSPWADLLWTRPWVVLLVVLHSAMLFTQAACDGAAVCATVLLVLAMLAAVSPMVRVITEQEWISVLVFLCIDFLSLVALVLMGMGYSSVQIPWAIMAFIPPLLGHSVVLLRLLLQQPLPPPTPPPPPPQPPRRPQPPETPPPVHMTPQSGFHVPEMVLFRNITMMSNAGDNTKKQT